jgi:hypothetical protein
MDDRIFCLNGGQDMNFPYSVAQVFFELLFIFLKNMMSYAFDCSI